MEFRENDPIKRILSKRIIVARFEMNSPGRGDSTIGSKVENLEKSSIAEGGVGSGQKREVATSRKFPPSCTHDRWAGLIGFAKLITCICISPRKRFSFLPRLPLAEQRRRGRWTNNFHGEIRDYVNDILLSVASEPTSSSFRPLS